MNNLNLLPVFMIGLLGSVHCVGMCGGIVSALSLTARPTPRFPVDVVTLPTVMSSTISYMPQLIAYNVGRVGSYMLAGAIAGGLSGGVLALADVAILRTAGYWLANLMLVALGLYLMGAWLGLAALEKLGRFGWQHVQRLMRPLLPIDTTPKALAIGAVWGWVPCGMVYSVLLTAMLTGSPVSGAAVMLAFGMGTLPMLLGIGLAGVRMKAWSRIRSVRIASGLIVLGFGILGLIQAANGTAPEWLGIFCVTPSVGVHP